MVLIKISSKKFLKLGLELVGYDAKRQHRTRTATNVVRFRSNFGAGPKTCRAIFRDLQTTEIEEARIDKPNYFYFLVALNWLKTYKKEGVMAGHFKRDEKTLRENIRVYVKAVQALAAEKIQWIDVADDKEIFILTVDGVHFRINEPRHRPSSRWYSHKSDSAGLAYEIAISIHENKIVWINGPFMAAEDDRNIFLGHARAKTRPKKLDVDGKESDTAFDCLYDKIPAGKKGIADRLYEGDCQEKLAIRNDLEELLKKLSYTPKRNRERSTAC